MKQKLVILNNGLKDHRGHYFETSISIAEAARQQGFAPILATHSTCPIDLLPDWLPAYPLFTTDHWMTSPPAPDPDVQGAALSPYRDQAISFDEARAGETSLGAWLDGRFDLPRLDAAIDTATELAAIPGDLTYEGWRGRVLELTHGGLDWLRRGIQVMQKLGWCGERLQFYFAPPCVDVGFRRLGNMLKTPLLLVIPRILQPRFFPRLEQRLAEVLQGRGGAASSGSDGGLDGLSPHAGTRRLMETARARLTEHKLGHEFDHARRFLRDLERLLAMADIGPRDHVLLGTAHYREMLAIDWLTCRLGADRSPSFHLEFRHPLFHADPSEAAVEASESLRAQRGVFALQRERADERRIWLYTDTDELRDEYELLTALRFEVLPIPFRAELITPRARSTHGPLTLVFLGDARDEKGFPWLPDLIDQLMDDFVRPGRVRFRLQATLGTPAYNPKSAPALARLRLFGTQQVELVGLDGPLPPEKYYELVSSADVVLLPYDRNRYRAASSGTLAEAIGGGRPAIVPADSWMSTQLAPGAGETFHDFESFVAGTRRVIENFAQYRAAADAHRRTWLQRHSPAALVAAIRAKQGTAPSRNRNAA